MPTLQVQNLEGKELREITLADTVFGITPNTQAMFDAVMVQRAALHQGTHKVKNRSEVRGGGRKPWRQKGTGRARQGSIRSPQWRGGGVVFGPTPRSYDIKLNRKVRRLALRSALSQKVVDGELKVVENLVLEEIKTKGFIQALEALNIADKKVIFVVDANEDFDNAYLSMRNLRNVMLLSVETLNVYDIMNADVLVLTEQAAKHAEGVWE
ncbi:MAG: 50S ribosomal protein L4 [Erysipelothrix sp.]|nr:50S ribosomal protein L4 [Erysipelothrix sp.]